MRLAGWTGERTVALPTRLLCWSGWSLMPESRTLTPTDPSAMFRNLEPKGLAHRERPGRACFFQRGAAEIGAGQRVSYSEQLSCKVACVQLREEPSCRRCISPLKMASCPLAQLSRWLGAPPGGQGRQGASGLGLRLRSMSSAFVWPGCPGFRLQSSVPSPPQPSGCCCK